MRDPINWFSFLDSKLVKEEKSHHPLSESLNATFIVTSSVSLDALQAASVLLELQDLLVKTGLKGRSRLLLGPFSCSTSLEARWCRHSGSPGPDPGPPKLLLDLKGGLLQVCPWPQFIIICNIYHAAQLQFLEVRVPTSAPGWISQWHLTKGLDRSSSS